MIEENYAVVTETELLSKTSDTENNFIERKTVHDHQGWLETVVAFANSCPIGQPGILYVGVDNNGKVHKQQDGFDFEKLQKSISAKITNAWPSIFFVSHILKQEGLEYIAVVVFGSPERPHFSGPAYVRVGPETKNASESQYDAFVAQRSSKVRALQKLIGQIVHWHSWSAFLAAYSGNGNGVLADCNQFFVTIRADSYTRCFPVDKVMINFDPNNNRYMLMIPMD